jgi:hypothetical protein
MHVLCELINTNIKIREKYFKNIKLSKVGLLNYFWIDKIKKKRIDSIS